MPPETPRLVGVIVYLDRESRAVLQRRADEDGRSLSSYCRRHLEWAASQPTFTVERLQHAGLRDRELSRP
jgi:hypothetical protein